MSPSKFVHPGLMPAYRQPQFVSKWASLVLVWFIQRHSSRWNRNSHRQHIVNTCQTVPSYTLSIWT